METRQMIVRCSWSPLPMRYHSYVPFCRQGTGWPQKICPNPSLLPQLLAWSTNILKTKSFGAWTKHPRLLMANGPTALVPQSLLYEAAAHVSRASWSVQTKQNGSASPGDSLESKIWPFTADTTLEGSQALPRNNPLLFLTLTLSSCSHKSQISHISCGFLACLSAAAKLKACYHSSACWYRDTHNHKKNKTSK